MKTDMHAVVYTLKMKTVLFLPYRLNGTLTLGFSGVPLIEKEIVEIVKKTTSM